MPRPRLGCQLGHLLCLRVTEVDPDKNDVLFERFLSNERDEPPDIDLDFEHERREDIAQLIYRTKGRTRAALTATVIAYRSRSAIRDVGKALGLSPDILSVMANTVWGSGGSGINLKHVGEAGMEATDPHLAMALELHFANPFGRQPTVVRELLPQSERMKFVPEQRYRLKPMPFATFGELQRLGLVLEVWCST